MLDPLTKGGKVGPVDKGAAQQRPVGKFEPVGKSSRVKILLLLLLYFCILGSGDNIYIYVYI